MAILTQDNPAVLFVKDNWYTVLSSGILLGVSSWILLHGLYNLFFSPLRHVPGPFLARFTRLWEFYHVLKEEVHKTYVELHKKYGPVVRIGPNRYSIVKPEDAAILYGFASKFTKSRFYSAFTSPDRPNIFTTSSIADHTARRKRVADLYSMSTVVAYEHHVDIMVDQLMKKLTHWAESGESISLPTFLQFFTFDVIGMITINAPFGLLENEKDVQDIVEHIHDFLEYGAHVSLYSELHTPFFRILEFFKRQPKVLTLFQFVVKQIELHRADGKAGRANKKAESFLSKSMDLVETGKFTMDDVFDVCAGNIGAGSDTTAVAMNAAIFYIYRNPTVLQKLREELETARREERISDPITFKESQTLPYLQAVIKEALRIHPPIGEQLARVVPKGGAQIGGYYFPEGTEIGANGWAVHHCSYIFGSDASEFKPERWLGSPADQNKLMLAFGSGARTCIGKNISLLELAKAIPAIVLNFDIEHETEGATPDSRYSWVVFMSYTSKIRLRRKLEQ